MARGVRTPVETPEDPVRRGWRVTRSDAGPRPHHELLEHLARTTPLSSGEAARVVAEVIAEFDEPAPTWVRRRHAELQAEGLRNPEILRRVAAELPARRFAAPDYSERQLRRIVYG